MNPSKEVNTFVKDIQSRLIPHTNEVDAAYMAAYMKHHFPFLGIKKPILTSLTKEVIKELVKYNPELAFPIADQLWSLPEREYQIVGLDMLDCYKKQIKESEIEKIEGLIIHKSWWDTVDMLASKIAGEYFKKYPHQIDFWVSKWSASDNLWLNRSAILFQLKYKSNTNLGLLERIILMHAHQKEFFIAKAIGWILREYAKTDPAYVRSFVSNHPLQKLSRREALKHLV